MTAEIQFVSYATSGQTRQLLRRKLCTNIISPTLYGLLYSAMFLNQEKQ